jgi:mannose-6-phosphate isomerase
MQSLYPLKFKPILKDKIWGGQKLAANFGKDAAGLPNVGESWEISGVDSDVSVVENGFLQGNSLNELIEVYMGELVGEKVFERFGEEFPLLIKFIDANDDLSIQVHPDDKLSKERHNAYGKTEMWYVMQANAGAELISGFNRELTKNEYLKIVEENKVEEVLSRHPVKPGDVFFMPAGRVHAIGAGILLAEIQQTSDVTYRIYDFMRRDDQGNLRELHTELAVDAIDFSVVNDAKTEYATVPDKSVQLASCPYFTTNVIELHHTVQKDYFPIDSFVIYICTEGSFEVGYGTESLTVTQGESVLIPADLKNVSLTPRVKSTLLEVYIQ